MDTFVMLTRVAPTAAPTPHQLELLEREAVSHIRRECPDVKWLANYAVLGHYNYVDIFEAPDVETATKVSTIVRSYGGADAEVMPATAWRDFKALLHSMPDGAHIARSGAVHPRTGTASPRRKP
jgi:uncharacterized protein with GYD domain